jgi:hypothetical protein
MFALGHDLRVYGDYPSLRRSPLACLRCVWDFLTDKTQGMMVIKLLGCLSVNPKQRYAKTAMAHRYSSFFITSH